MGPTCPTCGWALTWYAQQNAWGCDRCRVMLPPNAVQPQAPAPRPSPAPEHYGGYPSAQNLYQQPQMQGYVQAQQQLHGHAPHAAASHARAAPAARNKVPFVIAGVVLLAGAGVGIVLATRGGGSDKRAELGPASRDALVKATFASLGKGDLDGLMKRSGFPGMEKYITCEKGEEVSEDKKAEEMEDMKAEFRRALSRETGSTFEVLEIIEGDKIEKRDKGEKMGKGCKLDVPIEMHPLTVRVSIRRPFGRTDEAKAEVKAMKIDGQWITATAPKIPGCNAAVARMALVAHRDSKEATTVNALQPALMKRCMTDEWSSSIVECVEKMLDMGEAKKCLDALPEAKKVALTTDVEALIKGAPSVAAAVRPMLPGAGPAQAGSAAPVADPAVPPPTTADGDVNVRDNLEPEVLPLDPKAPKDWGTPEPAAYGDFWLAKRSDGAVKVLSPIVSAVFPTAPKENLEKPATKTRDNKTFWLYQFIHDMGDDGMLRLEIGALGRNAKDEGADPMLKTLARIGPVRRKRVEQDGVTYTDLEARDATGNTLRTHTVRDMKRGIFIIGVAATNPKNRDVGTRFLNSVQRVDQGDPVEDPDLLANVRAKKDGKKFVAQTANGDFAVTLPWQPKITRTGPSAGKSFVQVALAAEKKKASVLVQISEFSSWDGLTYTPDKQAELPGEMEKLLEQQTGGEFAVTPVTIAGMASYKIDPVGKAKPRLEVRMLWNRHQYRHIMIMCTDVSCDQIASSIKVAAPTPPDPQIATK